MNHTTTQPLTIPASSTSSSLLQVSGALVLIILFIVLIGWIAKRCGLVNRVTHTRSLKICASASVGPREKIVIIEVEDARLVLGITAGQISHLHTLPPAEPTEQTASTQPVQDFRQLLAAMLHHNRKV